MGQQSTADWIGCSVEQMNAQHDKLHQALCDWLGIESQALRVARGENLTHEEYCLANYEEDAVLHLQRLMARHKIKLD